MKTNRFISLTVIAGSLLCWLVPASICASVEVDGIYYELDSTDMKAYVARNRNFSGAADIPPSFVYDGVTYSVTSISQEAFYNCGGLTSATIPSSVTSIGSSAFRSCPSLTSVTVPSSVIEIGMFAFDDTPWFDNQPDGMVYINDVAYRYKGEMPEGTFISIKDGTVSISRYAFNDCSGLTSIEIPNSVIDIGDYAFFMCTGLSSVVIPSSMTEIGSSVFYGCYSLASVEIPNSVTSIGGWAFDGRACLTSVTIPGSVTSIGYSAFADCSGLTSVEIPSSVTSIGDYAFARCTSLTSITCKSEMPVTISSYVFQYVPSQHVRSMSPLEPYRLTVVPIFGTSSRISRISQTPPLASASLNQRIALSNLFSICRVVR